MSTSSGLKSCAKDIDALSSSEQHQGMNAVHVAAKLGSLSVLRQLVSKGVSLQKRTSAGLTPMDCALSYPGANELPGVVLGF